MVEITYQIVLSTLQTAGILAGITYYIITLKNQQKSQELTLKSQQQALETRQAQLFMQLVNRQTSKDAFEYQRVLGGSEWSTYDKWESLMDNNLAFNEAWHYFAWMWESIGALLREGLVDVRLLALYNASGTIDNWEWNKHIVYGMRERRNYQRCWCEWEYCYITLMNYLEDHPEFKS